MDKQHITAYLGTYIVVNLQLPQLYVNKAAHGKHDAHLRNAHSSSSDHSCEWVANITLYMVRNSH